MADRTLNVKVTAQDEASSKLKKMSQSLSDGLKKVSVAATAMGAAMAYGVKKSIDAYAEAERSQRQLEHAVIGVSKGTADQVKAIADLTDAMQKKVGIDGDALKMGAAQLSTFGLQSETVVSLTKSLADLTVNQSGVNASAEQYVSSANIMAKALQGQFGILEKSGIRFTELQKKIILTGTESEKAAALTEGLAQNLRETTDTLGGADVAQARLNRSLGEVSEAIGAAMLPALSSLTESLVPLITKVSDWIAANPELVAQIIKVTGVIVGLAAVAWPLVTVIGAIGTALAFLAANPIVLIIGAIVALGAAIYLLITHWEEVKVKAVEVWGRITDAVVKAWEFIQPYVMASIRVLVALFTGGFSEIFIAIVQNWDAIKATFASAFDYLKNMIFSAWEAIKLTFLMAWEAIKLSITMAIEAIMLMFTTFWETLTAMFTGALEGLKNLWSVVWEGIKNIVTGAWEFITNFIFGRIESVVAMYVAFGERALEVLNIGFDIIKEAWSNFWDGMKAVGQAAVDFIVGIVQSIVGAIMSVIDKINELKEKAKAGLSAAGGAVKGAASYVGGKLGFASGGNVYPGRTAMVGENGPELMTFSRGGRITPTNQLGGGGQTINIILSGNTLLSEAPEVATKIGDMIIGQLRLQTRLS